MFQQFVRHGGLRVYATQEEAEWRNATRDDEYDGEQYAEWCHERPSCSILAALRFSALFAIEEHIDLDKVDSLSARLAAMGLLGFDLDENSFFYRRLPFKTERILSLNPRMIAAEKLLEEDKVEIIANDGNRTEARVAGSGGVRHTVILDRENEKERCTCTWFSSNQGERGACKHILAVKKLAQWKN